MELLSISYCELNGLNSSVEKGFISSSGMFSGGRRKFGSRVGARGGGGGAGGRGAALGGRPRVRS